MHSSKRTTKYIKRYGFNIHRRRGVDGVHNSISDDGNAIAAQSHLRCPSSSCLAPDQKPANSRGRGTVALCCDII